MICVMCNAESRFTYTLRNPICTPFGRETQTRIPETQTRIPETQTHIPETKLSASIAPPPFTKTQKHKKTSKDERNSAEFTRL